MSNLTKNRKTPLKTGTSLKAPPLVKYSPIQDKYAAASATETQKATTLDYIVFAQLIYTSTDAVFYILKNKKKTTE